MIEDPEGAYQRAFGPGTPEDPASESKATRRLKGRRHVKRGKESKTRFLQIEHWMMDSFAWRSLSPTVRCVWIEAAALYNGRNNGYLALATRRIGDRIGVSHSTVSRALNTLETLGFVEIVARSEFSKKRLASEYRLTHLKCNKTGKPASKLFMSLGKRDVIGTSENQDSCRNAPMARRNSNFH